MVSISEGQQQLLRDVPDNLSYARIYVFSMCSVCVLYAFCMLSVCSCVTKMVRWRRSTVLSKTLLQIFFSDLFGEPTLLVFEAVDVVILFMGFFFFL